ncbi:hypothetical protein OUZ56_004042 [Daphnia magna]|uniref:Cuticle protein n=1 Tax=Daphnia magna TaxID=35525 RepID=A0ABQ9YNK4_9CRUS|nr:hypothetical protein OUZ56_004042 [Daphnia magna]
MKVFLCIVLVALVAVNGQSYPNRPSYKPPAYPSPSYPTYPKPSYPSYPKPSYPSADYAKPAYPQTYETPMPYDFAWEVKDAYTYNNYNHQEAGDDKGYVTGSYSVDLPDGRKQTVAYKADDYTGYVADVKYEGEAKYPENKPAPYKPAAYPEYKPAYSSPTYPKPAYPKPAYKNDYPAPSYPSYRPPSYPSYPAPKYPARY